MKKYTKAELDTIQLGPDATALDRKVMRLVKRALARGSMKDRPPAKVREERNRRRDA